MFLLIMLIVFILIGLYLFVSGFFPIKIEISHLTSEPVATIHKKSIIPPFKDIEITVPNLRQAVMGTKLSRSSHSKNEIQINSRNYIYRVELESSDGTIVPVTNSYNSNYTSKQKLLFKINESIKEKTPLEYVITQYENILIGAVFIVIPSIVLYDKFIK